MDRPKQFRLKRSKAKSFNLESQAKKSASDKGYDAVWNRYRFRFLHYNKKCYACGSDATVVDHIRAHKGDDELFKNLSNHMPLCRQCHNTVTTMFDKRSTPLTEAKIKWINERRDLFKCSVTIKVLDKYDKKKRGR